ncbi:Zinc finger protein [Abeliophyllum distichum]|uniref:Zinc finger protein n=1 Tax=Abeliophyllum distichum TaxID=126358 RepID=A0ABD1TZ83_9LAMI
MLGKNKRICHGSRRPEHYLQACPKNQRCPLCGEGFVKWMEVKKKSANLGRLLFCCSSNCGYFKWSNDNQSSCAYVVGESSGVSSGTSAVKHEVEDLSRILKIFARISEEEDVEISVNVAIRKGQGSAEVNNKEKGKTKLI